MGNDSERGDKTLASAEIKRQCELLLDKMVDEGKRLSGKDVIFVLTHTKADYLLGFIDDIRYHQLQSPFIFMQLVKMHKREPITDETKKYLVKQKGLLTEVILRNTEPLKSPEEKISFLEGIINDPAIKEIFGTPRGLFASFKKPGSATGEWSKIMKKLEELRVSIAASTPTLGK